MNVGCYEMRVWSKHSETFQDFEDNVITISHRHKVEGDWPEDESALSHNNFGFNGPMSAVVINNKAVFEKSYFFSDRYDFLELLKSILVEASENFDNIVVAEFEFDASDIESNPFFNDAYKASCFKFRNQEMLKDTISFFECD